jgi:hypothetical protein
MDKESSQDKSERPADETFPHRPIVEQIEAKTATHEGANKTDNTCKRSKAMEWLKIVINVVLGGIALTIYKCQLTEMRNANIFAGNAAAAANDSVKQAREASHLEQRAWVAPFGVPKSAKPEDGNAFKIDIPIINTGKSFAREVGLSVDFELWDTGPRPNFTPKGQTEPVTGLLLAPGGTYTGIWRSDQTWRDGDAFDKINGKSARAVLFGTLTYYDIFDCVHWTTYCFILRSEDWTWEIYKEHNQADNDKCDEVTMK